MAGNTIMARSAIIAEGKYYLSGHEAAEAPLARPVFKSLQSFVKVNTLIPKNTKWPQSLPHSFTMRLGSDIHKHPFFHHIEPILLLLTFHKYQSFFSPGIHQELLLHVWNLK